ncbi:FAD-binding oxidoreductase [Legionella dresdenensis]|uniref:FAD-binding oxidoreductase n=1 Tax=Legionella dresdenensis TaxID=450200 RepID=A0ABV8CFK7_9GAMM
MQMNTFPLVLSESYLISPRVKHFVFSIESEQPFSYLPGQFITVHFEHEGKVLKRSYSIANPPGSKQIEFAAGYVEDGPGTRFLFNLNQGDRINVSGPFGRLVLKDDAPGRYILAATSTGITPYRAMLPELTRRLQQSPSLKVVVLLGVQSEADAIYSQEFIDFANACPQQVEFRIQLSRPAGELAAPCQFKGYVQHSFSELNLNPAEDLVYLCGNPGMIDEAFESLKASGFAMQQIVREKYISR